MIDNREYLLEICEEKIIPLVKNIANKCLGSSYTVEKKGHGNFVTDIDKAVESSLIQELKGLIPTAGVIAEESGVDASVEYNWIIDPIDGTTNFIYGFPHTISIALAYKTRENIVLGVVYNPTDECVYYACKGCGSYKIQQETRQKIQVNDFANDEGVSIFGMPYDRQKTGKILEIANIIYTISSDLKRIGPASLDICRVAEGQAKVYFELDLNLWDVAAGILILKEAGGIYKSIDDLSVFGTSAVLEQIEQFGLLC